jgi:hypothetical protein
MRGMTVVLQYPVAASVKSRLRGIRTGGRIACECRRSTSDAWRDGLMGWCVFSTPEQFENPERFSRPRGLRWPAGSRSILEPRGFYRPTSRPTSRRCPGGRFRYGGDIIAREWELHTDISSSGFRACLPMMRSFISNDADRKGICTVIISRKFARQDSSACDPVGMILVESGTFLEGPGAPSPSAFGKTSSDNVSGRLRLRREPSAWPPPTISGKQGSARSNRR